MLIYVICDYYIQKTDLADLSSFKQFWEFGGQILKSILPLESGNLQLEQTKFPVVLQNFLIPFSLFSLCSWYPVHIFSHTHKLSYSRGLVDTGLAATLVDIGLTRRSGIPRETRAHKAVLQVSARRSVKARQTAALVNINALLG